MLLTHAVFELANTIYRGVALGIVMIAILGKVPKEFVMSALGTKRGASAGQVMAFLVASPWNSFSLTLILIALVGLLWASSSFRWLSLFSQASCLTIV